MLSIELMVVHASGLLARLGKLHGKVDTILASFGGSRVGRTGHT